MRACHHAVCARCRCHARWAVEDKGEGTSSSLQDRYQDSNSITQSELMRMMNDNSKDEEIQAGNYLSYIPTESVHRPRHA